eukprot:2236386-Rhodomonas_salina.1
MCQYSFGINKGPSANAYMLLKISHLCRKGRVVRLEEPVVMTEDAKMMRLLIHLQSRSAFTAQNAIEQTSKRMPRQEIAGLSRPLAFCVEREETWGSQRILACSRRSAKLAARAEVPACCCGPDASSSSWTQSKKICRSCSPGPSPLP